jgi:predicted signal transduction protein with EAL and GGDEF domain
MKDELIDKINFETELKSALLKEEIFLTFQPIFNLKDNSIRGFEVLVRWNSPKLGMVGSAKFIPVAEELGMIVSLGEWIIKTACKTFKKLQTKYGIKKILSIVAEGIEEEVKVIVIIEVESKKFILKNMVRKTKILVFIFMGA